MGDSPSKLSLCDIFCQFVKHTGYIRNRSHTFNILKQNVLLVSVTRPRTSSTYIKMNHTEMRKEWNNRNKEFRLLLEKSIDSRERTITYIFVAVMMLLLLFKVSSL